MRAAPFYGAAIVALALGSPSWAQQQQTSPIFVYELVTTPPTAIAAGATISFPDTAVGQTSSMTVRVRNTGNGPGTVGSISVAGKDFQLAAAPGLPQELLPNSSMVFNLAFTPTQPGELKGTLFINADLFNLTGRGLAPQLAMSYMAGDNSIAISAANPSVVFSPVMISQSGQTLFHVKNTGTVPAVLSNIGIGEANSPFKISGIPALPVTIAPGAEIQFPVTYTPTTTGFSNGTLRLDTTSVQLIGSGTEPPALPAYTITGPSGDTAPMSQPAIGLKLSAPYPVALSGTLNLSVSGSLPADPAVQFATGGVSTPFVIPANTTDAIFGNQGSQIRLQTGTVAESITLTPTFATQAGSVDITPQAPATLQFTVASAPPTLVTVQASNVTATGFVLTATGFSPTRSLSAFNVQFTPAAGVAIVGAQLTIDLTQVATVWFQSNASLAFGGQFSVSVPFTFTASTGQALLNGINSFSVNISNSLGSSNTLEGRLQ